MAAAAIIQRPYRGSRVSTFYPVKTLPPLSSLDSAFQLQEYISLLIRHDVHDVERIVSLPGKLTYKEKEKEKDMDERGADEQVEGDKVKGDVIVDEACWIYEQLRRLAQDLTHPLITMLQQECNRSTCPEMKAGEWLYLCVAHGTDGAMEQCCAIDYILHTLDSATALLNSPRAFPSRLQIPSASHRHFSSLARRLGRIFAHAYFHHRDIFAQAEAESSLYARFLALTSRYDLVPPDFIVIPSTTKIISSSSFSGDRSDDVLDEGDNDIPRDATRTRTIVVVPPADPNEVEPPRLLAAALDPQAESQRLPTSMRVIVGNRNNNKSRSPSAGLFVGGGGLIPVSAAATTTAPTTAASLFESAAVDAFQAPITATATTTSGELESGRESPRKTGRQRTDTVIYSGAGPIPVVSLGARLNEPTEGPRPAAAADATTPEGEDKEGTTVPTTVPVDVPPTSEESKPEAAETVESETLAEEATSPLTYESDSDGGHDSDFEPVDEAMVVDASATTGEEQQPVVVVEQEEEEEEGEVEAAAASESVLVVGEEQGHEEREEHENDLKSEDEHVPVQELVSTPLEENRPESGVETSTELHAELEPDHADAVATDITNLTTATTAEGEEEKEETEDEGEKAADLVGVDVNT